MVADDRESKASQVDTGLRPGVRSDFSVNRNDNDGLGDGAEGTDYHHDTTNVGQI